MALGPLPSPGPFGRIVDVRVWPHGFTTEQGDIVRPNIEDATWHATTGKWGGNIVWTGSTPRHTIAYNGPRGRYFGPLSAGSFRAMKSWFAHNGAKVDAPSGLVLAACVKTYDSLPTSQTYAGTGNGTLDVQTPSTATGALTGDYEVRCIEAAPVPRFLVTGPDAQPIGVAEAGPLLGAPVLFDGAVRFTLQAGSVAFVVGDTWVLTVEEAEQFVVIVTPAINATPQTETVWRRGVSLSPGSSWRQIASIAPVAAQVDGSIQPWFFNASATRAVTCRGLGADAEGYTLGTVGRTMNLETLGVADVAETSAPVTYTETRVVNAVLPPESAHPGQARDVTITTSTTDSGARSQLMALDYVGDVQARIEIEFTGSVSGSANYVVYPGDPAWCGSSDFNDKQYDIALSGGYSAHADLVLGAASPIEAFDVSCSGTRNDSWACSASSFFYDESAAYRHRVMRDIAGITVPPALTEYLGTVRQYYDTGAGYRQSALGVTLRHLVAGAAAAEVTGASGPVGISVPGYAAMLPIWPGYEGSPSSSSTIYRIVGVGALGSEWTLRLGVSLAGAGGSIAVPIAGGGLPSANTTTGKGLQTSAQDIRGNWLMAAEIAAFGSADLRWPGQIGASGSYTLQAGGPDSLTPATVATLTAHPGDDRWNIGVF